MIFVVLTVSKQFKQCCNVFNMHMDKLENFMMTVHNRL